MPRQRAKKLMLVLAIFALMTEAGKKADFKALKRSKLQQFSCIHYPAQFFIKTLIDSNSKVNTTEPNFMKKLSFRICKINIDLQKIKLSYWLTLA